MNILEKTIVASMILIAGITGYLAISGKLLFVV